MNRFVVTFALSLLVLVPAFAQEAPPAVAPQPGKKTVSKRAKVEVLIVQIGHIDAARRTLTLKVDGKEQELTAHADDLTEFFKEGKPAKLADFAEGEKVTIRLSLKPGATTGTLKSVFDSETGLILRTQRTQEVEGTVVASSLTNIDIKLSTGTIQSYRVSEKTLFVKADRPAKPTDFQKGDPVAIRPRGLPGGAIQAVVVADRKSALEAAHTDSLATWAGMIEAFSETEGLRIKRADGAVRTVTLAANVAIAHGKAPLTRDDLKPGMKVRLHLVKSSPTDKGQRTADKVTVSAR